MCACVDLDGVTLDLCHVPVDIRTSSVVNGMGSSISPVPGEHPLTVKETRYLLTVRGGSRILQRRVLL